MAAIYLLTGFAAGSVSTVVFLWWAMRPDHQDDRARLEAKKERRQIYDLFLSYREHG